jgi:hypothetical protein
MKEKNCFDLTRIQSPDFKHMSPVCYHRANGACDESVLIYNT